MSKKSPEGAVQKAILDYLAATHVMAYRMQSGVANFGGRRVPFGLKGMADILAFPMGKPPMWIECKAPEDGKQSEYQRSFQTRVIEYGHDYVIAMSLDDVIEALEGESA